GGVSHRLPLGRVLVVVQIALSLVLVAAAGLFVRTLRNVVRIDAGFERETLVTAQIDVRAAGYTVGQLPALYERLLAAGRAVPGVQSVSLSRTGLGIGLQAISSYVVQGRDMAPGNAQAQENDVTVDFFRTTGIQLHHGRTFTDRDVSDDLKVAVVSLSFARHFFGTDSVVGRRIGYGTPLDYEIIGVVGDVRVNALRSEAPRMVFKALDRVPRDFVTSLEARVAGRPAFVIAGLRNALARVDRNLPVRDVAVMDDVLTRGLVRERMTARLAGGFGLLALLLAAIGLYGVISYSLARRANEMGVRLALGASPAGVSWVVLRDALVTIVLGLAVGIAISVPVLGLTGRLVYGLSPNDPATLAASAGLMLLVGLIAALVPAVRASRTDPAAALRSD
ncbi:MAG: FtsX-like permease family protein, partial [Gemmatimonadaceae bacterium]